ncbi:Qnr family pentapeptide repeat protein [Pseudomonas muyukensis]|uniref:Qnr family pentapeptide repeat protein n=1 Tax=Pseudomonas muyukensis TaxID=2842357 RepID=A0ABX8M5X0_9PSED|nr:Qnr family pentapeptide repeat protein [Pseudomonas muyukensis]QXH33776.1 Qnr family pentapeptide repeat protein [Pseudomonas muyukensis]
MESPVFENKRFDLNEFTGRTIKGVSFLNCDFSRVDLSETQFVDCIFYDRDREVGCSFRSAKLKGASFKRCDLSVCVFNFASALGLEISESKAQGADFSSASFMNVISSKSWFCSAFINKSNLAYANFSKVNLEKCELWDNRWTGANLAGASFAGSDLSGGDFTAIDWHSADFTGCDLTDSELGDLDLRTVNLEGVKVSRDQMSDLAARLGINVLG